MNIDEACKLIFPIFFRILNEPMDAKESEVMNEWKVATEKVLDAIYPHEYVEPSDDEMVKAFILIRERIKGD